MKVVKQKPRSRKAVAGKVHKPFVNPPPDSAHYKAEAEAKALLGPFGMAATYDDTYLIGVFTNTEKFGVVGASKVSWADALVEAEKGYDAFFEKTGEFLKQSKHDTAWQKAIDAASGVNDSTKTPDEAA